MAYRKKKSEETDVSKALLEFADRLTEASRSVNILGYEPHKKQKYFHEAMDPTRLYIGGNRSGKSFATCAEDIWWATGTHPLRETPQPPLRGRVVAVDLLEGVNQIILPIFKQLTVGSMLRGGSWEKAYSKYDRILHFANRSTIEFMSYEMKTEKFAGTSRDFTHFDEEPPQDIYEECLARLVDTDGSSWISMTPVEGLTWLYDMIYLKANNDKDKIILLDDPALGSVYRSPAEETTIIEVSMSENPHLPKRGQERYLSKLSADDRAARERGTFVQKSGQVFKSFSKATHVIPAIENPAKQFRGWTIYTSVDHGWNNPTAWLWHAVSPDGHVVTFHEHYAAEMTVRDHSLEVLKYESRTGIEPYLRTGDPALKQTSGITGTSVSFEYAKCGINLVLNTVPRDIATGLALMQQYFQLGKDMKPMWLITEDCEKFIHELKHLHFKKYATKRIAYNKNPMEEIQKKDDHTFDSARYFATFLPELTTIETEVAAFEVKPADPLAYDAALLKATNAELAKNQPTQWKVLETY